MSPSFSTGRSFFNNQKFFQQLFKDLPWHLYQLLAFLLVDSFNTFICWFMVVIELFHPTKHFPKETVWFAFVFQSKYFGKKIECELYENRISYLEIFIALSCLSVDGQVGFGLLDSFLNKRYVSRVWQWLGGFSGFLAIFTIHFLLSDLSLFLLTFSSDLCW